MKDGIEALLNTNSPKVVLNLHGEAMYFSRSVVPFLRGVPQDQWLEKGHYYKHVGIYAYRRETLAEIAALPQSPMELAESLEQLRWLENGFHIQTAITDVENLAVDTPEDLDKVRAYFKSKS